MLKFKHAAKGQYSTKIEIIVPGDFGQTEKHEITVTLKRYRADDGRAALERLAGQGVEEGADPVSAVLRESVLGWSGIPAEEGGEVPYSAEALDEMLKLPEYRRALLRQIIIDLRGPDEIARKN